jgi:hypothetical protein
VREERRPSDPEVRVAAPPLVEDAPDVRVRRADRAEDVPGEGIEQRPGPRLAAEPLEERQRRGAQPRPHRHQDLHRGEPALVNGPGPERLGQGARVGQGERLRGQADLRRRPHRRDAHAEVLERRLEVASLVHRPDRIGLVAQRPLDGRGQRRGREIGHVRQCSPSTRGEGD